MVTRVVAGIATGLLWYVALGYLDAVRFLDVMQGPGPHWGALLGALVVSIAAIWLTAGRGFHFRAAVAAGLVLGMGVGVLEYGGAALNVAAMDAVSFLMVPGVFARGVTSVAVWTAVGVCVALTIKTTRRTAANPQPANQLATD